MRVTAGCSGAQVSSRKTKWRGLHKRWGEEKELTMKHRAVLSILILLFLCATSTVAAADIWAISRNGENGTVHISKNGKVSLGPAIPGIARDLALTKDGTYLYVTFSDLGCGRPTCNGEGIAVIDTKLESVVAQIGPIKDPRRMAIDETDSILYVLSGDGIQKYDISPLPTGGRSNQRTGWNDISQPTDTSGIDTRQGDLAIASFFQTYWAIHYCGDALWVDGLSSCIGIGLPAVSDPNWLGYRINDVMISPDRQSVFGALSTPGTTFQFNPERTGNLMAFDVRGNPYGLVTTVMLFGSAGVFRLANVGTRFYATTDNDGMLYCGDFTGATYPPRPLGIRLTGMVYGYDGKLYVADGDGGVIYPITLGGAPARDRVGKGYVMPVTHSDGGRFQPGAIAVGPPVR